MSEQRATDLVCGMKVDPETSKSTIVDGKSYYFCCERCQSTFDRKPKLYIASGPST